MQTRNYKTSAKTTTASFLMATIMGVATAANVSAASVTSTDFDCLGVSVNNIITSQSTGFFDTSNQPMSQHLAITVYKTNNIYTYQLDLNPADSTWPAEFNTGFAVNGFTGIAGYSFSDVLAAKAPVANNAFTINYESDGTIDWNSNTDYLNGVNMGGEYFWYNGELITFFFQSTSAPTATGIYNFIQPPVSTINLAPAAVPVPSAFSLLSAALVGLAGLRQKRFCFTDLLGCR